MLLKSPKTKMLKWFKHLFAVGYYYVGTHKNRNKAKAIILMYHRVLEDGCSEIDNIQPGMYVTASSFEMQMSYLCDHYEMLSIDDFVSNKEEGALDSSKRYCVITMDDGWVDNYRNAFPVFKKYGVPATIFLTTSFIGTNQWFWPDLLNNLVRRAAKNRIDCERKISEVYGVTGCRVFNEIMLAISCSCKKEFSQLLDNVIERMKQFPEDLIRVRLRQCYEMFGLEYPNERVLLDWEEVKEMSESGISFGSHTCTHKILTTLSIEEASDEINTSLRQLESKDLNLSMVFCYPNGSLDEEIEKVVRECGYSGAISTNYGVESFISENSYRMKRIGIHEDVSSTIPLFVVRICNIYRGLGKVLRMLFR